MAMAAPLYFTADDVIAMPDDGNRYEVVHGELLVTPAPRLWHEVLVSRMIVAIGVYLRSNPVGIVLGSRGDIVYGKRTKVEPDVFVVPLSEARSLDWKQVKRLLLVAEVLSQSSARADRFPKRLEYQRQGIPLYWIVDGDAMQVELWTPDTEAPRNERDRLDWHPAGAQTPFSLSLADLFRPV
jgi:Uma2 family endonuclease